MTCTRRARSLALVASAALIATTTTSVSADAPTWQSLFKGGLRARAFEHWGEAVVFFGEASRINSVEGGSVYLSSTFEREYFPHFYLGEALFETGAYGAAFKRWAESLRQGRLTRRGRGIVDQYVGQFGRLCVSWQTTLGEVRGGLVEAGRALGPRLDALAERGEEAGDLREAVEASEEELERVRLELTEMAGAHSCEATRRGESLAEKVAATATLAARLENADETLHGVLRELGRVEEEVVERRAQLSVKKAAAVREQIEALQEGLPPGNPQPRPITRTSGDSRTVQDAPDLQAGFDLTPAERATGQYLLALVKIFSGMCEDTIDLLRESRKTLAPSPPGAVHSLLPYLPHSALALAARNCGDLGLVRRELAEAEETENWFEGEGLSDALDVWLDQSDLFQPYVKKYALLIGAEAYGRGHQPLPNVRSNLEEVGRLLSELGYELPMRPADPTGATLAFVDQPKNELAKTIEEFLAKYGADPKAALLLYWSGHGDTADFDDPMEGKIRKTGYILPFDMPPVPENAAEKVTLLQKSAIHLKSFARWADENKRAPLHTLFIFESCYSGIALEEFQDVGRPGDFDRARVSRRVRMFLSSTTEHQVSPADTRFREELIRGIQGCADEDGNRHVTGPELATYLDKRIRWADPRGAKSMESELSQGEYVFERIMPTSDQCPDPAATRPLDDEALLVLDPKGVLGSYPEDVRERLEEARLWTGFVDVKSAERMLDFLQMYTRRYPEPLFGVIVDSVRSRIERGTSRTAHRTTVASH